jgi:hypothetical protein
MADIQSYIKTNTEDKFWSKISDRSADKLKKLWTANKDKLENSNTRVVFFEDTAMMFNIDNGFIENNNLNQTYLLNKR